MADRFDDTLADYYLDQGIEYKADHDFNPEGVKQMADKEWRPKNWLNPVQMRDFDDVGVCQGHKELYEAGASAMLKAVIIEIEKMRLKCREDCQYGCLPEIEELKLLMFRRKYERD